MKPHDIKKILLHNIQMEEDEFTRLLFFDDKFLAELIKLEAYYRAYLLTKINQTGSLRLSSLDKLHTNEVVLITPSARKTGMWQRTVFWKGEPISHQEYERLEELVNSNSGDWLQYGMWIEEEKTSY